MLICVCVCVFFTGSAVLMFFSISFYVNIIFKAVISVEFLFFNNNAISYIKGGLLYHRHCTSYSANILLSIFIPIGDMSYLIHFTAGESEASESLSYMHLIRHLVDEGGASPPLQAPVFSCSQGKGIIGTGLILFFHQHFSGFTFANSRQKCRQFNVGSYQLR